MAMLAEPRKRKQYNLVPRGKALYEDDSRFGTKMLEKMGWSKGKGLGANEDGIKDFVRVRCRNRAEGLGFEDRDDQWTQHEESFTGLLQTLNENSGGSGKEEAKEDVSGDERTAGFGFPAERKKKKEKLTERISGESLEEKSKQSKARVHYKKFTRGKDLSRYSEKDLLNIFGKKAEDEKDQNAIYQQFNAIVVEPQETEVEDVKANFGVHSGLSVSDYFKQKMEAMKNKMKNGFKSENEEKELLVEQEESASERKVVRKKPSAVEQQNDEIVEEEEPKKKKKKRNKDNIEEERAELIEEATEEYGEAEVIKKKKKKSKNKADVEAEEVIKSKKILNEEGLNDTEGLLIVESNEATSKKSKKRKHKEITNETETIADESTELGAKKPKKKKSLATEVNPLPVEKAVSANNKKSKKDVSSPENFNLGSNAGGGTELLSLDDLIAKRNSYNVYTISSFCAEKFRNVDLERFTGSTMPSIMGYSLNVDLELNIKTIQGDEHRITQLWNCTLNKYKDAAPKRNTYFYYQKQVRTARKTNQKKMPHFHVKTWKRKQVFQGI